MPGIIEILDSDDDVMVSPTGTLVDDPDCGTNLDLEYKVPEEPTLFDDMIVQTQCNFLSSSEPVDESFNVIRNRRRRKSVHQPIRESDDISFVTISLDDDDDTCEQQAMEKQPSVLDRSFDEFINEKKIDSKLRKIAEERVRVNWLLDCYRMPDIVFNLYNTQKDLNSQLTSCMNQHSMSDWQRRHLQELKELKKQRSMPQNK